MSSEKPVDERLPSVSEVTTLIMACLAPWAIGAVDAWAQLLLDLGLVVLAISGLLATGRSDWARRLVCMPSLALAGLALLALVQAVPLPALALKTIAPSTHAWRTDLAPGFAERVKGD